MLELQRRDTAPPGSVEWRLARMEELFAEVIRPEAGRMQRCVYDQLIPGGKRLRPRLAALAADFGEAEDGEIVPLMALLEMTHTASLIHDDVVDRAVVRRGRPTISARYGDRYAVQSGDFLLSRAVTLMERCRDEALRECLFRTSAEMCLGELQQLRGEYDLEAQTGSDYLLRIKRKTAYLMASCCYAGAVAGGVPEAWRGALEDFGLRLGIAFQLNDDVLDFRGADREGKPALQDLARGVFTLPVLHALRRDPDPAYGALLLRRGKSPEELERLRAWVDGCGGLAAALDLAGRYVRGAVGALSALPEGPAKDGLTRIARAAVKKETTIA